MSCGHEDELRKLRRINQVLMDRVERDMDSVSGNAFSIFQAAITLESRVAERTAELTRQTQRLLYEIAERREAEIALKHATAEAEQANIGKTRFLAAASHDLHQPLNAARLFLGSLSDEVGQGRQRELVERVEQALDTVSELLDTLLDISRLDAGAWTAEPKSFRVGPLLSRLAGEYGPQAAACGLSLRHVPSGAVIHTDRCLLERVLRNFISNGIRYTDRGRVLIGCRHVGVAVRIEVWDTGIGIPDEAMGRIFEEFRQLGNNPRERDKGIGLGLAIVDRIARLLDAPVHARSRAGRGSCFGITVPLGTMPEPAPVPVATSAAREGLSGRMVVAIDNDPAVLNHLCGLLEAWGCRFVATTSGGAALDRTDRRPDAIIADYMLDGGRLGTDAIAALRARYGSVPALVISSDRSAALKAQVQAAGCAFLAKPARPAKLRAMLCYMVGQTALAAE